MSTLFLKNRLELASKISCFPREHMNNKLHAEVFLEHSSSSQGLSKSVSKYLAPPSLAGVEKYVKIDANGFPKAGVTPTMSLQMEPTNVVAEATSVAKFVKAFASPVPGAFGHSGSDNAIGHEFSLAYSNHVPQVVAAVDHALPPGAVQNKAETGGYAEKNEGKNDEYDASFAGSGTTGPGHTGMLPRTLH
jgi:hypothetical protein